MSNAIPSRSRFAPCAVVAGVHYRPLNYTPFALEVATERKEMGAMTGMGALTNALLNPTPALRPMDLVGPTADDDIRRAIARYGVEEVKAAFKRQTKPKIGRPKVPDLKELRSVIEADAHTWLEGGDPFARANYSIAKDFADANPGHSYPATMKRIQRKLRDNREWMTLATAWSFSKEAYPHSEHIRTLEALSELDPPYDGWGWHLDRAKGFVADFERLNGEPPAAHLTMTQVEEGARPVNALLGLGSPPRRGGLAGLLGAPSGLSK